VIDGWTIFNAEKEYQRLGLASCQTTLPSVEYGVPTSSIPPSSTGYQVFRVIDNTTFTISPTYPQLFVIPKVIGMTILTFTSQWTIHYLWN
jgi:hypothetical protein